MTYEVKKHRDEPTFAIIGRDCCIAAGRHAVYPRAYLVYRESQAKPVSSTAPEFKLNYYSVPVPADGIFKPMRRTDTFWPATRVRSFIKEVLGAGHGRQNFDTSIRILAERLSMPPEELLRTNPIPIGRRLGIHESTLSRIIGNYAQLNSCREFF